MPSVVLLYSCMKKFCCMTVLQLLCICHPTVYVQTYKDIWHSSATAQVHMEEMHIQKQIGEGSFGKVYLAKWKETTVAVKILTNPNSSSDDDFPTRLPNPLLQSLEKVRAPGGSLHSPGPISIGLCVHSIGVVCLSLRNVAAALSIACSFVWPCVLCWGLEGCRGLRGSASCFVVSQPWPAACIYSPDAVPACRHICSPK